MLLAGICRAPTLDCTFPVSSLHFIQRTWRLAAVTQLERGQSQNSNSDWLPRVWLSHFTIVRAGWQIPGPSSLGPNSYLGGRCMFPSPVSLQATVCMGDLSSLVILPTKVQASSLKIFMAFHYLNLCCETSLYHLYKKYQSTLLLPTQQDHLRRWEHLSTVGYKLKSKLSWKDHPCVDCLKLDSWILWLLFILNCLRNITLRNDENCVMRSNQGRTSW